MPAWPQQALQRRLSSCVALSIFSRLRGFWATWGWRVHRTATRALGDRPSELPIYVVAQELWRSPTMLALGRREGLGLRGLKLFLPLSHFPVSLDLAKHQIYPPSAALWLPGMWITYFIDFPEHILNPEAPSSPLANVCSQPVCICLRQQFSFYIITSKT